MESSGTTISPAILESFTKLFRGRGDVYGSWGGGCVKQPLTQDKFLEHLQGDELIGVYPLLPFKASWFCVWGCSDIDVDDLDAARNLQMSFAVKGITSWVERTRKGYHIWVFADSLVPAATMRRAFLAAHQAINYPAKEVNPKQETAGTGYGNYVRLPYPNARKETPAERYILDNDENIMSLTQFLEEANANLTTEQQLDTLANLWRPPQRVHITNTEDNADIKQILRRVGAIPYIMWRDGPIEGNDRSSTLFRLACKMRDANIPPNEALVVVRSADARWGKFQDRADGESELIKLIERAYVITMGTP